MKKRKKKKKITKTKEIIYNCTTWIEHYNEKMQNTENAKKIAKYHKKVIVFEEYLNQKLEELKQLKDDKGEDLE